ncbi:hypothetical protein DL95DRAFT_383454 [Leptodontidium sp. 2 PMI_412]|nr:hypothetical protein BKA61DRAFT_8399 [Leptodontidium sp. MPI-SDFR-AT-0119]KAH9220104.1 hypothetical protein DL95DRAFT_383454 [Leptodontidium sp. 2 PMI_412]
MPATSNLNLLCTTTYLISLPSTVILQTQFNLSCGPLLPLTNLKIPYSTCNESIVDHKLHLDSAWILQYSFAAPPYTLPYKHRLAHPTDHHITAIPQSPLPLLPFGASHCRDRVEALDKRSLTIESLSCATVSFQDRQRFRALLEFHNPNDLAEV